MDFSALIKPLIKPAIVGVAAYMAYTHSKNQVIQGVAMTVLGIVVAKQIPIVQDEI